MSKKKSTWAIHNQLDIMESYVDSIDSCFYIYLGILGSPTVFIKDQINELRKMLKDYKLKD